MTRPDCEALFEKLALELGLNDGTMPWRKGWTFGFDSARRRFGCCNFGSKRITLSWRIAVLNDEKEVSATIRHEIAHARVGPGHGHDHVWREEAIRCGDDGRRCYDSTEVHVPDAPWTGTCPACGTKYNRHRAPKPGRTFSCSRCSGGRFNPNFILVWTTTNAVAQTEVIRDIMSKDVDEIMKISEVLRLRATGMGYVAIDARFGIFGKKGWWSWKIVKTHGGK
jgi:predicted SprT family Zn-dependent metalloprotease